MSYSRIPTFIVLATGLAIAPLALTGTPGIAADLDGPPMPSDISSKESAPIPDSGPTSGIAFIGHDRWQDEEKENRIFERFAKELARRGFPELTRGDGTCLRAAIDVLEHGRFNEDCAVRGGRNENKRWVIQVHIGRNRRLDVYLVDALAGGTILVKKTDSTIPAVRKVVKEIVAAIETELEEAEE